MTSRPLDSLSNMGWFASVFQICFVYCDNIILLFVALMTFIVQNVGLLEQIITVFSDAKVYIWAKIYSIYFSNIFLTKKKHFCNKSYTTLWMTLQALRKMGEDYRKYFSKNFSFLFKKLRRKTGKKILFRSRQLTNVDFLHFFTQKNSWLEFFPS